MNIPVAMLLVGVLLGLLVGIILLRRTLDKEYDRGYGNGIAKAAELIAKTDEQPKERDSAGDK